MSSWIWKDCFLSLSNGPMKGKKTVKKGAMCARHVHQRLINVISLSLCVIPLSSLCFIILLSISLALTLQHSLTFPTAFINTIFLSVLSLIPAVLSSPYTTHHSHPSSRTTATVSDSCVCLLYRLTDLLYSCLGLAIIRAVRVVITQVIHRV